VGKKRSSCHKKVIQRILLLEITMNWMEAIQLVSYKYTLDMH
jgi:hypothetical protein